MGSINNYPYQALIGNSELWCFGAEPSAMDSLISNRKADNIGYTPDPRASAEFFNKALRKQGDTVINPATPLNAAGDYYEIDNSTESIFTVSLRHSDDTPIDVAVLNNYTINGELTYQRYNFYVVVDTSTEPVSVKACGIAAEYTGTHEGNIVTSVLATPFTSAAALTLFNEIVTIRETSNFYGVVTTQLAYSNGFKITTLPGSVMSGKVPLDGSLSGTWEQSVLPCDLEYPDDYDKNGRYRYIVDPITSYTWADGLQSQGAVLNKIFASYPDMGSDLLRLTSDGQYTNGADLSETDLNNGLVANRVIDFQGGKFKIRYQYTYGATDWYFDLYDANNTLIDTWHVNGTNAPEVGTLLGNYNAIYNAYLVKYGGKYYIASMIQGGRITDGDGNRIRNTSYNMADVFAIVHEFNTNANTLLENGTETIIDYDPEHIDESSPEASTGDNQTENYDRQTQWSTGAEAGSNEGIRHNGSDIINASNYEETVADETPKASSPPESGSDRIITPLNSGAIKAFVISDPDVLEAFMAELNSDDFGTKLTRYFSNPMDVFISLHRCIAPAITPGASKYLTYGLWTSQNQLPVLEHEMYDVNMGFLNVAELTSSFKDYPPFCRYYIYLPYIGMREIDGKLIAGKRIELYYHINVLTGDILADLRMHNERTAHTDNIYYWSGNTLASMPLKSTDYSSMISGLIATAISVGGAVATGNPLALLGGITRLQGGIHPDITMLGTVTGSTTFAMPKTPYIVRIMPEESNKYPENYNRLQGRPSNIGAQISSSYSSTGNRYIVYSEADLANIYNNIGASATEDELLELKRQLMEGVYV